MTREFSGSSNVTPAFTPMANAIRALAMDAVQAANSGHPGMPMGMADVATVLWSQFLKFDPDAPRWADRDRFILSAGHGSMLLYSALYLTGYAKPALDDIRKFRQLDSVCAGHPENFLIPGAECTTGPLGQGFAMAVGMAIAERHLNAEFGDALVDHRTWVIAGDGCLMEGINHEAVGLAGTLGLGRLNVLWDDNRITIDGDTSLSTVEDIPARYRASGWHVTSCDGYDHADIARAMAEALADPRPSLIACHTIIGKGAPNKQGSHTVHGSPLGAEEIAAARKNLGWTAAPFEIPAEILNDWRATGDRGRKAHSAWEAATAAHPQRAAFDARMAGDLPDMSQATAAFATWFAEPRKVATRKASELSLEVLAPVLPALFGGSADLTGSNLTQVKSTPSFGKNAYGGRHVHYGIREFGMAAAMNGAALHGGLIAYGGTFLVFSDYCRNAIRLSALQHARVIYVMTHDSIGLGEDGPTHQPVEHVMSLRLIPNLHVFRPADIIETAECWQIAVATHGPSLLALSRQNLPQVPRDTTENRSAKGAYRLVAATAARKVVLVATGSEVEIAMKTAAALEVQGIGADVVSMPCSELFDGQDAAYRADVLPKDVLKVSIEAGVTMGWQKYVGDGLTVGIDTFGASAPADQLYDHFGLTADKIVPQILARIA
ncbi:transketolase [Novosphingobium sp.]|uniref:transketolase n=1 Tax=Novosphingobium sp. TaxID=1874826 RepID=UPI003D09DAE4